MRMVIAAAIAVSFSTAAFADTGSKAVSNVEKVVSWSAVQTAETKVVNKARCWVCGPDRF
jgi:hypothetical protein